MNDMTTDVAHKHVCSITGDIVCGYSGETAARMPDDGLLNGVAVNEIPSLDACSVDLNLESAGAGEPEYGAMTDYIDRILKNHVGLIKGRTPENGVRNRQVSRNGYGCVGRELLIAVQTKQEVDEVGIGILGIVQTEPAEVVHGSRGHFGLGRCLDFISTRIGAQRKNSNQENSKHKKCRKHRPAELFRFYHAIKFSSFPQGYILIPTPR